MPNQPELDKWNNKNLSHLFTVGFFKNTYGDDPHKITATISTVNAQLNYFNNANSDNNVEASMCAGSFIAYLDSQGLSLHVGKTLNDCYVTLSQHLAKKDGKVITTAGIIEEYFKFWGEQE